MLPLQAVRAFLVILGFEPTGLAVEIAAGVGLRPRIGAAAVERGLVANILVDLGEDLLRRSKGFGWLGVAGGGARRGRGDDDQHCEEGEDSAHAKPALEARQGRRVDVVMVFMKGPRQCFGIVVWRSLWTEHGAVPISLGV